MSITSDFYLARADECALSAHAATLDNVRDRLLRSEAAWRALANRLQRSEDGRSEAAAEKALRAGQGGDGLIGPA